MLWLWGRFYTMLWQRSVEFSWCLNNVVSKRCDLTLIGRSGNVAKIPCSPHPSPWILGFNLQLYIHTYSWVFHMMHVYHKSMSYSPENGECCNVLSRSWRSFYNQPVSMHIKFCLGKFVCHIIWVTQYDIEVKCSIKLNIARLRSLSGNYNINMQTATELCAN